MVGGHVDYNFCGSYESKVEQHEGYTGQGVENRLREVALEEM